MSNTVYPKGIRFFKPFSSAPDFVKGGIVVTPNELIKFCKENEEYLTEYNGEKQLKLQLLEGKDGLYITVNTYKG